MQIRRGIPQPGNPTERQGIKQVDVGTQDVQVQHSRVVALAHLEASSPLQTSGKGIKTGIARITDSQSKHARVRQKWAY